MKKLFSGIAALLLAGSLFLCAGWMGKVREDVVIGGAEVGGMSYAEAERTVREALRSRNVPFVLHTPNADLYPGIVFADDVAQLVRRAKRGARAEVSVRRYWPDAELFVAEACRMNTCAPVDAQLVFSRKGFEYVPERAGVSCDYARSLRTALAALEEGKGSASLVTGVWNAAVTVRDLKARTQRLSSFTTYFDAQKTARVHNISLACERIAGSVLQPGETFSFNAAVGERTAENGFMEATVILEGAFVSGVGGGVCQASTTLMGAALRAGLSVTESRPHSLSVGYVPPSLDAMVSQASDLKFSNPYSFPVYLMAHTAANAVTFEVYGKPDGNRYVPESCVLYRIPPPAAEIVEGEEERVVRAEREGLASESYLAVYDARGALLSRRRLRRDRYACVQGIYQVVRAQKEEEGAESP